MSKTVKIILSIVGLAAVIVPALLLIFLGGKSTPEPEVASDARQIDTQSIKDAAGKTQPMQPEFASPSPATSSANPLDIDEGSPSAF